MIKTSLSQINRQVKLPFPFNLQAPGMGVEGVFRPGQCQHKAFSGLGSADSVA
jgi:hypothetical protein